jgi:hypothetical protein
MFIEARFSERQFSMKRYSAALVLTAGLILSGPAMASTVLFSDDFESYAPGTPSTLGSTWTVNPGTIDVIGPANGYNWYGPGQYIDLNGTPDSAAKITTVASFDVQAGQYYTLSFDYGNNKNSNSPEQLLYGVGGYSSSLPIAGAILALQHVEFTFLATLTESLSIFFQDANASGGDLGGPILDNVLFASVPLPAGLPLLGAGVGALGLLAWKRRRATGTTLA